jgi:hypothetical protein
LRSRGRLYSSEGVNDEEEEGNEAQTEEQSLSFTGDNHKKKDDEFNLNVSFTGGYVPNTDLARVDKG